MSPAWPWAASHVSQSSGPRASSMCSSAWCCRSLNVRDGVGVVALQRRAADRKQLLAEQADRLLRRLLGLAVAHGHVDQAALQVDGLVAGRDAHIDVGVERGKGAQPRDQPQRGKAAGGGDGQMRRPAVAAQPVGGVLQALQELGRRTLQDAALVGQRQAPRAPLEQRHAQVLLQRPDLAAHRRLGDEQLLRRLGEAQRPGRRLEALDQVQRGQVEALSMHSVSSCIP